MRYAVGDEYARELAVEIYRALFAFNQQQDVAAALNTARKAMFDGEKHTPARFAACDHATPVIYGSEQAGLTAASGASPARDTRNPRLHSIAELTMSGHEHFVGRTWELAGLGAEFIGTSTGTDCKPVAIITGLGGMGKTALVAEALALWETRFDWVLIYQAKPNRLELENTLRDIHLKLMGERGAYQEHVQSHRADAIYRDATAEFTGPARLERLKQNLIRAMNAESILLVFDNFETNLKPQSSPGLNPDFEAVCQDPEWDKCLFRLASELVGGPSRVLITCRRPLAALAQETCHRVLLGPLPPSEAALYLRAHHALRQMVFGSDDREKTLAKRLLTASRFHPLLMDQSKWQTPPAKLRIVALGDMAALDWNSSTESGSAIEKWNCNSEIIETYVKPLNALLDGFRQNHDEYLNQFGTSFEQDLASYSPPDKWVEPDKSAASAEHQTAWAEMAQSAELRDVATAGFKLFNQVFRRNTEMRRQIGGLPPGSIVEIRWHDEAKCSPIVPWGLMYVEEPKDGQPIDARKFLGLRFRCVFICRRTSVKNKALGNTAGSKVGQLFLWRDDEEILQEAKWQKEFLKIVEGRVVIPQNSSTPEIEQVKSAINQPAPRPMPVLYLFCHGLADEGALIFANGVEAGKAGRVRYLDITTEPFDDCRFVFCNACESAMCLGGTVANLLQQAFFDRECFAYLGPIHKVPPKLASKFAAAFFHFFARRVQGRITSSGEAAMQAQQFLWNRYRNIGGLFYSYLNEHRLYLASTEEVAAQEQN